MNARPATTTAPRSAPAAAVRRAGEQDVGGVTEVLCAAFREDPVFAWTFPDPVRRVALAEAWFGVVVESHIPLGEVYVAGSDPVAAAVWLPPGLDPDPDGDAELTGALVAAGAEHAERVRQVLELAASVHPTEDHAYLFVLGARPERQSQGLGGALLRQMTQQLDRARVPAYLEATTRASRRLYLRHGFADLRTIQLPAGPPLFTMWREPCRAPVPADPKPG